MKNIRRHGALALILAMLSPGLFAGVLPNSGGKLDYGIDDLPIPDPILHNNTRPRTAQLLAESASAETTPFEKMQLLTQLGDSRMPQCMPTLIAALQDKHAGVRASAAAGIAVAGAEDSRAVESRKLLLADAQLKTKLQTLLSDADLDVAIAAMHALISLEGPGSPAVESAIKSSLTPMLAAGIEAASRPEQAKAIVARMGSIPVSLQPRALLALGRSGDASSVPLLIERAKGSDVPEVVAASGALAMLKASDAAGQMEKLLGASHPSVRREAMRAFGVCSKDRRIEVATSMLKDEDPTVRQAAVEVIGDNLVSAAVASIVPQLATDYRPLYLATRKALISAKDQATRDSCIDAAGKLLNDSSPRRQEDGSYVLGHYRSDHMLERHIALLDFSNKPDWDLIAQAAYSTGRIARQEARPVLVKLVLARNQLINSDAESPKGVNAAIVAAGQLGADEILAACERILAEDPLRSDVSARSAACFTFGVAGTPESPGVMRIFNSLHNPMDGAKIEALKAVGNLKFPGGEKRITGFPGAESHQMQWLAQWATARITGQPEEHPPTIYSWTSRTSIGDLTEQ